MSPDSRVNSGQIFESLSGLAFKREEVQVPGRGSLFNYTNADGIELRGLLDQAHLPDVTKFTTVVLFPPLADIRGESPAGFNPAEIIGRDYTGLRTISEIARDGTGYDLSRGRSQRAEYIQAMVEAARQIYASNPRRWDEVVIGVERCGANLGRALTNMSGTVEAKRLRIAGNPDLLAAGVNLPQYFGDIVASKDVRLLEGVLASGSTVAAVTLAFKNEGIMVNSVGCDAVIVCPAGARFMNDFRSVVGASGRDIGVWGVGTLDPDWYVRYHEADPIQEIFGDDAATFNDAQVLGDGGDLTSNI